MSTKISKVYSKKKITNDWGLNKHSYIYGKLAQAERILYIKKNNINEV